MNELLKIPVESREPQWEDKFLHALTESNLKLLFPDPKNGPDGWPYLIAETDETAAESAQKILSWLATRGVGLVINPQKEYPDYVLSYGMIWFFRETGRFHLHNQPQSMPELNENIEMDAGQIVHAGTPTPQYLPDYVRKILREFFRDQAILDPRILLISKDRKNYDLAFSVESLGNPPQKEWQGIAEAVAWFLPTHYSIVLVSDKSLPAFSSL